MHHDQATVFGGPAHGAEDGGVIEHENSRIGHEQLERRDALLDQPIHLLEDRVVDLAHDHVESIVDVRLAFGFSVPLVQSLAQRLAVRLDGEVDDGGGPAPGGRRRAGGEVVGGKGAAEWEFHVRVDVERSRHDVATLRIDHLVGSGLQAVTDGRDRLAVDQDIGLRRVAGRDHRPVLDQGLHGSALTRSS